MSRYFEVAAIVDKISEGFPKDEFKPQPPLNAKFPFKVILEFNKNGVSTQVTGIVVSGQG